MVAPSLTPGQTLGHFRLIEEIGAGGMGIVYRAWDTRLERDVAVKVLNAKTLSDASARKRFRREALILSRLNHPNVESVYDFHSEQGVDYLVLEYVPGTSLNERLERSALSEKEVLALGIQLARGLAAAHAQRVLHRDLKPGNLRVTPDNVLKILDFGLAQLFALPEDKTLTTDETEVLQDPFAGTPAYLSPEQIKLKEPDTRSDIYSAGVVLYEMATGSQPFPQRGQMLADAILHSVPPAPRMKNKDISLGLEVVILKCMEKDPKLRYQSASELLDDLKELAGGLARAGRQWCDRSRPRNDIAFCDMWFQAFSSHSF
jgi:serine/threonine protein kinase